MLDFSANQVARLMAAAPLEKSRVAQHRTWHFCIKMCQSFNSTVHQHSYDALCIKRYPSTTATDSTATDTAAIVVTLMTWACFCLPTIATDLLGTVLDVFFINKCI